MATLHTSTATPVLLQDAELAALTPDADMARRVSQAQLRKVIEDLNGRAAQENLWPSWVRAGFWTVAREYLQEVDGRE